jgi:N-acyl amino acid synthase of PEP-CTERM/exosortase system
MGNLEPDYAELYGQYFAVIPATTPDLIAEAYQLRYQVYCIENQYETPAGCDGQEIDEYDSHSAHAVLIHRTSGQVCGCVRLVLPAPRKSLPVVKLLDPDTQKIFEQFPRAMTAEVSRYAVSKAFRRRANEEHYADTGFFDFCPEERRRLFPHITLGLMIGIARLSVIHGVSHLSAVMAPPLLRLLNGFGMSFTRLGTTVDYHGNRQPCIGKCDELLSGIERKNPGYFSLINAEYTGRDIRHALELNEHIPEQEALVLGLASY